MTSDPDNRGKPPGLIRGQNVSAEKLEFARTLRRELSPVERALWRHIRAKQLCDAKFRRQQVVGPYIADFYCANAALAVEVDGDTHDMEYDGARDRFFESKGVRVLRFSNAQVLHELDGVLQVIAEALSEAPGRTSP